jgi:hypothetical protein
MCNLYSITTNQAAIIALFRVTNRYVGNLPPKAKTPAITVVGEMRESGPTRFIVYCAEYKCAHSVKIDTGLSTQGIMASGRYSVGVGPKRRSIVACRQTISLFASCPLVLGSEPK